MRERTHYQAIGSSPLIKMPGRKDRKGDGGGKKSQGRDSSKGSSSSGAGSLASMFGIDTGEKELRQLGL